MSYTTLTADKTTDGSIKQWINNGNIPASVVLSEAETFVTKRLRVRRMLTLYTGTIATSATSIDLDANLPRYEEILSFRRAGDYAGRMHQLDHQHFEERLVTNASGNLESDTPTIFCVDGSLLRLNTAADRDYPVRIWYYARPVPLSGSNDTNFLTDEFPSLIRHACLYRAFDYMKDKAQRDHHLQMAMGEITDANVQWDTERQAMELARGWEGPN
jgi:hypothetical protein